MRLISLFVFACLLIQGTTHATSYILPTWEESAMTSDFIGVVECVTAGGIVARYRVIDSWKGADNGTELSIRQHVDFFEPQFPISLAGDHFLVFASKSAQHKISSMSAGGGVPLWWRRIPSDLQCFSPIPINEFVRLYLKNYLSASGSDLGGFRDEVIGFLRADDSVKELRIMLSQARKNLHLPDPTDPSDKGNPEDMTLYEHLHQAASVKELWDLIVEKAKQIDAPPIPKTAEERQAQRLKSVLLRIVSGGKTQCKAILERTDPASLPWEKKDIDQAISHLRWNLSPFNGRPPPPDDKNPAQEPQPTAEDIQKAKSTLEKPWDHQTGKDFDLLCRHSPDSVVRFLINWHPSDPRRDRQFGYMLGSAFGHLCGKDRSEHLTSLCSAKDDWIKAAAATYLSFDDPKTGAKSLLKMMGLDGDPGAWAALVLASRGEKTAISRAIDVMITPMNGGMSSVNHGNLQKRLRVLLSNVAAQSGVSQPPGPSKEYAEGRELEVVQAQFADSLRSWWHANESKLTLMDPWLSILEEQKID